LGWIAGSSNKILKTTDGGSNWISYSVNLNINSIFMVNDSLGFACGYYGFPPIGYILKSTNGGLDWDIVKNDNSGFNSIFFNNPLNGWVVGRFSDKTLHTTNGGIDWTEINIGGKDIYFSNNLNGIIVNYYSLGSDIFITKDGGNNWILQPRVTDQYLYTAFADSDGFWGAGMSGTILYSNDPVITGMEDLLNFGTNVNDYTLSQNYPNPFNPSTKISWQSPVGGWQTLKVYDILGNEVATLVNEYKDAGYHEIEFNAAELSSGVYFYRIQIEDFIETKKMLLIR
ncbi:MAG TPA: T9SS type A sorting domain-containing protein, partial [Ignavibacteriaceae bacterium]|nr:T9SS type A sorting domain-containing protein [Ignavibacteriaceae bacterium]